MLVSHGIFQGCDGALLSVRELMPKRRVIAPSRFGYLGSDLPPNATPADQADAFVAVLDHLEVGRTDVVGISAGATAALQFALLHPTRVEHLVLISANLPGSTTAVAQPSWARFLNRDIPIWMLRLLSRRLLVRMAGVPPNYRCTGEDGRFVNDFIDSFFPIAAKAAGIDFDAFTSNPAVNSCPLERLTVPTLLIHARDDPLVLHQAAVEAAGRIPGSVLTTLESGGHLGLGQAGRIRAEVDAFTLGQVTGVMAQPDGLNNISNGPAEVGLRG
ncbi:MAG TPA: alpha/beta fold hydrolase [Acidimicrobiia bacterium]|nr:alpha/beta fold hydrolase [Acidimicrobiia bacterium]